jgi:hypothetical protein
MTWFILGASTFFSAMLCLLSLRMRLPIGVAGLGSPAAAITLVFLALRMRYSLSELGPFIVFSFGAAFLLAVIVSTILCLRAAGKPA